MKNNIEDRIKNIMSAVFEVFSNSINDNSSMDTIESWDSLKHMNLVVAMEEEFDITLNDEDIFEIINENDKEFKYHLDRFKYGTRYLNNNEEFHFTNAIKFIKRWDELLSENKYFFGDTPTIADWSIWPFVRQFRIACESQKRTNYFEPSIKNWLDSFENNKKFKSLMYKYELWGPNSRKNYFPSN